MFRALYFYSLDDEIAKNFTAGPNHIKSLPKRNLTKECGIEIDENPCNRKIGQLD